VGVRPQRDTECACQTKVRKLEVVSLVDEQVLRLQVTMQNPVRVAVVKAGR
jgi:hypothetical protein